MKLVGGSADLSGSNLTKPQAAQPIGADDYAGTYIHFGIREHAMAAIMNGLALHGGFLPFGGTFLCFADYARPAIRLSALMRLPVVYVMTHDSIGQGEDGPTHQPIEHLASLRAMPGLRVMRPADAVETAECWEAAVDDPSRPTVLVLSRQALRTARTTETDDNLSRRGAYVLAEAEGGRRDITILATGSEVEIALDARTLLARDGIAAAVVSMPCWDLFQEQSEVDRQTVLGDGPRIAIEAASPFGWTRYVDDETDVIALDDSENCSGSVRSPSEPRQNT
jgi:transketolase